MTTLRKLHDAVGDLYVATCDLIDREVETGGHFGALGYSLERHSEQVDQLACEADVVRAHETVKACVRAMRDALGPDVPIDAAASTWVVTFNAARDALLRCETMHAIDGGMMLGLSLEIPRT